VTIDGERLRGNTLDLSEGGAVCAVTAGSAGPLPVPGSALEAELVLDTERVWLAGAVLDAVHRRGWWILTVRFVDPAERDQDQVREHVFTALRRERSKGFR